MHLIPGAGTLPGKCFLCERSYEDNEQAVNTGWLFDPDYPHQLFGTKTVCANCAKAVAQTHGLVVQTQDEFVAHMAPIFEARDEAESRALAAEATVAEGVAGITRLIESTRKPVGSVRAKA